MNGTKVLLIGAAGAAVLYFIFVRSRQSAVMISAQPQLAVNRGDGGTLSTLGAWFGAASQLVGSYDPNSVGADRSTPSVNQSLLVNPVSASPAVLPYSYKQATIDVPSLLGTDDLFTPGYGSSGAYAESGDAGTAAGPTSTSYWA